MPPLDPDPAFAEQVDAYVSDDDSDLPSPSAQSAAAQPNDSIHLHRHRLHPPLDPVRLHRFHQQAVSFLDRAYSDAPPHPTDERRLLQQFHSQTMLFLDDAAAAVAASDPDPEHDNPIPVSSPTPPLSPSPPPSPLPPQRADRTALRIERDRARLVQHYHDAMSFLNRTDHNDHNDLVHEEELETAVVDRLQLQNYAREVNSFLDKAFRGDASVIVDEIHISDTPSPTSTSTPTTTPTPTPTTPAPPSASPSTSPTPTSPAPTSSTPTSSTPTSSTPTFSPPPPPPIVKSANLPPSIPRAPPHVRGSDGHWRSLRTPLPPSKIPSIRYSNQRFRPNRHDKNPNPRSPNPSSPSEPRPSPADAGDGSAAPPILDDTTQIEKDRAELERCNEEARAFLLRAYKDDLTVIVDDAGLDQTSTAIPNPNLHHSPSQSAASAASVNSKTLSQEDDDAYTDEEFQDFATADSSAQLVRDAESSASVLPAESYVSSSLDFGTDDGAETIQNRMKRYEQEAATYLDDVTLEDDEEIEESELQPVTVDPAVNIQKKIDNPAPVDESAFKSPNDGGLVKNKLLEMGPDADILKTVDLGRKHEPSEQALLSARFEPKDNKMISASVAGKKNWEQVLVEADNRIDAKRQGYVPLSPRDEDVTMDLHVEGSNGESQQWSGVRMETSFYRQIPRGATVRFQRRGRQGDQGDQVDQGEPIASDRNSGEKGQVGERDGAQVRDGAGNNKSKAESLEVLKQVEKERDVLMKALEELVNERSMLAAQVSEMKSIFPRRKDGKSSAEDVGESGDIDLAQELREAHVVLMKLSEETEETLSVLDARYQEALARALKGEELVITLEAEVLHLKSEVAGQGKRASLAKAEEKRRRVQVQEKDDELEELRARHGRELESLEEKYREESERRDGRIRELRAEVGVLQDKLQGAHSEMERQVVNEGAIRHLEAEISLLKRRIEEGERVLADERLANERKEEEMTRRTEQQVRETEERTLASEGVKSRAEVRRMRGENATLVQEVEKAEVERDGLRQEVVEARRQQRVAEMETEQVRRRFEEMLKREVSQIDQTADLAALQKSLKALKDGAGERETLLQRQLEGFKRRAQQAEQAAQLAEVGAREAAEIARLAQERSRTAVEVERAGRQATEREREALSAELERVQSGLGGVGIGLGLGKSGSRRGIRSKEHSSHSSVKESEDGSTGTQPQSPPSHPPPAHPRKRTGKRSRLFGS